MRLFLIASTLLVAFTTSSAHAYYPNGYGCPCDPSYNAIDFSLIDFSTGLPMCMSPYPGPATTSGCTPSEMYYARSMGPVQPDFAYSAGPNNFFYPFPFVYQQMPYTPACCGGYPAPHAPVQPPCPRPAHPTAPVMHQPKAGPPVVDAVDPFTVGAKEKKPAREKVECAAPSTVEQKPAEFELPQVSPTINTPAASDTKDAFEITPPRPPDEIPAATGTPSSTRLPRSNILLPAPRFVPFRPGNV